ncbi:MAG: hypothetical protein OHK93_007857 [Ramalina farinacea]|uniref:Uncharacterized protein n=1 Tax=Ramalina farinacea TaxID=258253 RepID=A0AA43TY02_9LECA|nr:hypothetical protein [Ramalina farinacea]
MNWVGGSLNRSRHNRNDAAVAAQKKHFAKVRAGYGPVKISPPSMAPLLPNWMQSSGTPFDAGRGRLLPQPDNQNQKRLEDFKTTRPLAQKLDSLQSRQQPLKRKLEVPRAESNGSRRLSKQTAQGTRSSPMTISSKASSTPSSSATRSKSPPEAHQPPKKAEDSEIDQIQAYRRRLLSKPDWMGLNRTSPTKYKFTAAEEKEKIGKRRRVTDRTRQAPLTSQKPRMRNTSYFDRRSQFSRPSQDHLSQAGISVRIGSAVDKSIGNSANGNGSSGPESVNEASDNMLDDEDRYPNPFVMGRLATEGMTPPSNFVHSGSERDVAFASIPSASSSQSGERLDEEEQVTLSSEEDSQGAAPDEGHVFDHAVSGHETRSAYNPAPELPDIGATKIQKQHRSPISQDFGNIADNQTPLKVAPRAAAEAFDLHSDSSNEEYALVNVSPFGDRSSMSGNASSSPLIKRAERAAQARSQSMAERKAESGNLMPTEDLSEEPSKVTNDEETLWKTLVNRPSDDGISAEPGDQIASIPTAGPGIKIGAESSLQETTEPEQPANAENAQDPVATTTRKQGEQAIEDEESTWRRFVFGKDEASDNDWDLEEPNEKGGNESPESSSSGQSRTQPSMIGEIATSPLRQNPHLLDESPLNSASSPLNSASSPAQDIDSTTAAVGEDSSPEVSSTVAQNDNSAIGEARIDLPKENPPPDESHIDSDNSLKSGSPSHSSPNDMLVPGSPFSPSSSAFSAITPLRPTPASLHPRTSFVTSHPPFTPLQKHQANPVEPASSVTSFSSPSHPGADSMTVQPSSTTNGSSSAWSPSAITTPPQQMRAEQLRLHQQARRQRQALMFRKPDRYNEVLIPGTPEPIILGRKRVRKSCVVSLEGVEGLEDTRGLGYGDEYDDIEDS